MGLRGYFSAERRLERLKKKAELSEARAEHQIRIADAKAAVAEAKGAKGGKPILSGAGKALKGLHDGFMTVAKAAPKITLYEVPAEGITKKPKKHKEVE